MVNKLSKKQKNKLILASGISNPELAKSIAHKIGVPLTKLDDYEHANGERYVQFQESVRGKKVFIIQSHCSGPEGSVNDAIMEQSLLIGAASGASSKEVTAVIPLLGYARQDRKVEGREPISVKHVLRHLQVDGAKRIVTVDMHSAQTQGIFDGQFDHLTAQPELRSAMRDQISKYSRDECVVVSPDAGATRLSQDHQEGLDLDLIHLAKKRSRKDSKSISRDEIVPEADGRVCLLFDDMIDTGGTLSSAAEALHNSGAKAILVAATHGIFSEPAFSRLNDAPIDRILVTDTVPQDNAREALGDKLSVVSIAPIIGSALVEIITNGSVSKIFAGQNHR